VIAGCGGSDAPPSSSPSNQAARAEAPLSEAEYQDLLDSGSDAVKEALAETRSAGSAETVSKRLQASATELTDVSGELEAATVPDAVQGAHAATVAALTELANEFASTAGSVEASEVCTAPAALATLTRTGAVRDLRAAASELRASGFKVAGLAPRKQPTPSVKLKSGMVLARKGPTGPGELEIRNGGARDGVVKLVAGGKRTTVHIRRKATATVTGIADGNYRVFFAGGSSWDGKRNSFSRDCSFTAFDDKIKFTSGNGQYTRYTITLNPVVGGTAETNAVDPEDFPRD
jgi:hypothetical protein